LGEIRLGEMGLGEMGQNPTQRPFTKCGNLNSINYSSMVYDMRSTVRHAVGVGGGGEA